MALDPSIALSGRPAQLMTPGDAVSLQHMSLQLQQQQLGIQRQQALQKVMSDPGMFDDKGMPSPGLIQKAYSIGDINAAHGLLTARTQGMLSEDKNMRSQTAHTAQMAGIEARKQADEQKRVAAMDANQLKRYKASLQVGHDIDIDALATYDAAVKANHPDPVGQWRERRLTKLDELEKSGTLASLGWNEQTIQMARDKINSEDDPEVARQRVKTTKMREQEQKAQLDSPYKTGQLAVANRRADQGDSRISLQEIGQQLKSDALDAKIANDERKAGIAEDTIALRDEHSKAVIAVRNARLDMQKDNAQTSAEERERHNKALEDAKARELDLRGKAYGERADKTSLLTGKPGGERAQGTTLLKADKERESAIAGLNRELEAGKITQEQHDAMISKLTAQGKGGKTGAPVGEIGFQINKDLERRGWMLDPKEEGGLTYVPGGQQDPKVIEEQEAAKARGRAKGSGKTNVQSTTLAGEEYAGPAQHGEEYLKQFKPEFADEVRKVAKGQVPIELISKTRGHQQQVLDAVIQYNPDWVYKPKASANTRAGSMLSKGAIDVLAEQILSGDNRARIGLSKGGDLAPVLNRAAELAKQRGWSGSQIAAITADYEGTRAGARTAGTRGANMEMAVSEAQNLAPMVISTSENVDRTRFPLINKAILAWEEGTGDEKVVRFGGALNSFINVYARAVSPTGVPTVHDKEHAREILQKNWSKGQIRSGMDQLNQEMEAARKSPGQVRKALREGVTGSEDSRGAASGPGKTPPPSSGSAPGAAAPGPQKRITATNPKTGEKVELKDGKWVPMQ